MINAWIAHGEMFLMEPINDSCLLNNGSIVSSLVLELDTTLKYFFRRRSKIFLEATNLFYDPIELNYNQVIVQVNYLLYDVNY